MAKLNTNKTLESGAATGSSTAPTWFSFWTALTGGTLLAYGQITGSAAAINSGDKVTIPNGTTLFTLTPAARQSEALARRVVEGFADGTSSSAANSDFWVQPHNGDPGANGTLNPITVVSRIPVDTSADLVYSAT